MQVSQAAVDRAFSLIAGEGFSYLQRVNSALETIWTKRPEKIDTGYLVVSDAIVAEALHDLVLSFGSVSTLLFDRGSQRRSENASVYKIRMDRTHRVADALKGIDTAIYQDRAIRNRHVHSDEYIAKAIVANPGTCVLQDIALSERSAFSSEVGLLYIRVYIFSEDKLLHLNAEFDVKRLYETNLLISERLGIAASARDPR
jgi:hypothetical protein